MKYYIIAGEASGDLHGSNLIKALRQEDPDALIQAWGGDLMAAQGATLRKHYRDLAFMGFIEVVKNLRIIRQNLSFCKKDILDYQPDAVIFIDYPGFNLRIAHWLRKVINARRFERPPQLLYYISPQIWAWHTSRVHDIKKSIDRMFCILPFEKAFYKKYDYDVEYVGHPLLDVIQNYRPTEGWLEQHRLKIEKPIIALLPGSRLQEIRKILPPMLSVVPHFPDYQFIVAGAASQPDSVYMPFIKNYKNLFLLKNQTYNILSYATVALVKSGTSTLETALFDVPQVVCYKGSSLSFAIAKRLVNVPYISLVNLIAAKPIVKELIQHDLTEKNLTDELQKILSNPQNIKNDYAQLRGVLGNAGTAEKVAHLIVQTIRKANRDV